MQDESSTPEKPQGLSSAKREDIWALLIAFAVFLVSAAAPETVYNLFKKLLYFL